MRKGKNISDVLFSLKISVDTLNSFGRRLLWFVSSGEWKEEKTEWQNKEKHERRQNEISNFCMWTYDQ